MQRRAVEEREVGVAFVEDQGEVRSRENNRIDPVTFKDRVRKSSQPFVLLVRANPSPQEFKISVRDILHLLRSRANDLDIANQAIKAGSHHLSAAKHADPPN